VDRLATSVNVAASSLSSGLVVRVKKASTVTVRVNDTAQALAQKPTEAYPPHVLVGAFDMRGGFHPAREVQKRRHRHQLSTPDTGRLSDSAHSVERPSQVGDKFKRRPARKGVFDHFCSAIRREPNELL